MSKTGLNKVYLLRHGETEWTLSGKHTGLTDIELTKNGRREAKKLKKSLKGLTFDHIYCSPLKRVRETCRLSGVDQSRVKIDARLLEWDYGDYEGITSAEIHKTNPGWTIFSQDPPHGETAHDVQDRIDSLWEEVLQLKGCVAFFSSGHITRVIGARWLKQPVSFGQHLLLSTAAKCILSFEHGQPVIEVWNA